jgi:hypothetical protein
MIGQELKATALFSFWYSGISERAAAGAAAAHSTIQT